MIGFFRYYDDYDFAAIAGSVRLAKTLPIEECQQYSQSLRDTPRQWEAYICMEEPFSQSNTGRAIIKRDQFDKILKAIRKASQYLSGPESDYSKFMNKCYWHARHLEKKKLYLFSNLLTYKKVYDF